MVELRLAGYDAVRRLGWRMRVCVSVDPAGCVLTFERAENLGSESITPTESSTRLVLR